MRLPAALSASAGSASIGSCLCANLRSPTGCFGPAIRNLHAALLRRIRHLALRDPFLFIFGLGRSLRAETTNDLTDRQLAGATAALLGATSLRNESTCGNISSTKPDSGRARPDRALTFPLAGKIEMLSTRRLAPLRHGITTGATIRLLIDLADDLSLLRFPGSTARSPP